MEQHWYRCKGCGGECVVFVDPLDGERKLGHSKPKEFVGIPNTVTCALYNRCETLAFFFREVAGDPLPDPDRWEPLGSN